MNNCAESTLWTSEHRLRVIKKFNHTNAMEESIDQRQFTRLLTALRYQTVVLQVLRIHG